MAPFMLIIINNWDFQSKLNVNLRVPTKLKGFVFQYAGLKCQWPHRPPILLRLHTRITHQSFTIVYLSNQLVNFFLGGPNSSK